MTVSLPSDRSGPRWRDLSAGLCVAGLLLPEAVAYAGLAHLPVVHALIGLMTGLGLYAMLGSSRFAIVAPTSSSATLSAAAVLTWSGAGMPVSLPAYTQAVLALTMLAGGLLMALALARQGQLSAFVSRPVLRGFALALAFTIVIKQLPDLLGLDVPNEGASDPLHLLAFVATHTAQWHGLSLLVSVVAALVVVSLRRWPQLPASLVAIVMAIAAAHWLELHALGVREVGEVVWTTLQLGVPDLPLKDWLQLAELAIGLVMLVFAESWGSMRSLALAHGDTLDPNRELMALGVCNLAAALLQGMPVGAGFSATTANAAAGASSRWAGVAALAVVTTALALALPALHLLPRPVLAVAVVSALWHALNPRPLLALWRMRRDRLLVCGAVLSVLAFGALHGMLMAIGLSLIDAMRRFSQPLVHELGELGATRNFVAIDSHQIDGRPGVQAIAGLLILRPEEPLFFASAERVVAEVLARAKGRHDCEVLILSLEESADIDSTAVECLVELDQRLQALGKSLVLTRVKEPVRDLLSRWAPEGLGKSSRHFWSVDDAVRSVILEPSPATQ